ncbi:metallophosphoesterase [Ensifer sp. ENS10]|uniref:metallophosphoesterase n=1 Tax=Ensifer sp. ENS10 TaxID=2769286 RepID=UPI001780985D|nr:metallophosphoesterase [Ensifer sp. ENS10]MBD9509926.1 metallophosphoesterase [Ensifer sp. ENS10]
MKAWIFSDLHTEFDEKVVPLTVPEADVCICAGDICDGGPAKTVRYLGEHVAQSMPVILVPGNHEYYRSSIAEGLKEALDIAAKRYPNVHVLSRRAVTVAGYRFVGATLWGDFNLYGNMYWALRTAQNELNDFRKIKVSKQPYQRFTSGHASGFNNMDKHFIRTTLDEPYDGTTVVVTHHAPSVLSLAPEFVGAPLTPSFVSNLELDIAKYQPVAWIHGHLHNRSDYSIIDTRVVCNPRGYPDEPVPDFDPGLVINLGDHTVG